MKQLPALPASGCSADGNELEMKLYLTCPKCRKSLPQVGNETLYPGDSVTCGMCDHVWIPIPARPPTSPSATVGRSDAEVSLAALVSNPPNDQALRPGRTQTKS